MTPPTMAARAARITAATTAHRAMTTAHRAMNRAKSTTSAAMSSGSHTGAPRISRAMTQPDTPLAFFSWTRVCTIWLRGVSFTTLATISSRDPRRATASSSLMPSSTESAMSSL